MNALNYIFVRGIKSIKNATLFTSTYQYGKTGLAE